MSLKWPIASAADVKQLLRNEQLVMAGLAMVLGMLGGFAGIAFREAIDLVQSLAFGVRGEIILDRLSILPWWHVPLATTLGGLVVGLMVVWLMPQKRPAGVADVIEASALRGARVGWREGLGAAAISATSIGVGGSSGREGPVVHLAASLAAQVAAALKMNRSMSQTVLGCGVAAGVAASFNAPIAGVFFALEVVTGNYALAAFTPVVIASVVGTVVSRAYFGDYPAFIIQSNEIASFWEFPAFAILGVVSAVVGILFVVSIAWVQRAHARIGAPVWLRPAMGGLLVGLIGMQLPHILGVGYEATDMALKEVLSLELLVLLLVAKMAATAITLGSGFGGGVFSPSLFIGAMLGGAFGIVATLVFPHLSSGHGAYTIVGMGAVAGAVLGAPISTILIVFELTGDYALTVAVMIATVISSQIMRSVFGFSFFTWQLDARGISLKGGREARILRATRIADLVKRDQKTVRADAGMAAVRRQLLASPYGEVFVVGENGRLVGTITLRDLADSAFDTSADAALVAEDVARKKPPTALREDDLEKAMHLMEGCGEEHIAVLDNGRDARLIGVLHERDVMAAYHRAVLETRREEQV